MSLWDRMRAALSVSRGTSPRGAHAVSRIEYDRQPLPGWQAALDAQHIPGTARLVIAWEPGDVWQPIHRWFIWQFQPWERSHNNAVKAELRGPHPRTGTRMQYVPATLNGKTTLRPRIMGGPCQLIDRRAWELHHEWERQTGERVIPRRLWVIQGASGGHPFTLSTEEQALRTVQGVADVPSAGDLPYAEFDHRVLRALERYDLWRWANRLGTDPLTNTARVHIARLQDVEVEANRLRWAQWGEFAAEMADGASHAARQDGLHRLRLSPVGAKSRAVDMDRLEDRYINDTNLEAVA